MSFMMKKRRMAVGAVLGAIVLSAGMALAQAPAFFRIGTGGTAGTYYPGGRLIANAVSQPAARSARRHRAGLRNGSVANVTADHRRLAGVGLHAVRRRQLGLYRHRPVRGQAQGRRPAPIATLYPETIHLVATKGSGIKSVADLKGKRVALDEPGSGTLVDARIVLAAYGLSEKDVKAGIYEAEPGRRQV